MHRRAPAIPTALLPGLLAAFFAGLCTFNMVLNNAYHYGATLYDSAIFGTILWRNGWELNLAPALGGQSFYVTHVSPIHYLPNALSYLFPGDRITFYALVYALVYAVLVYAVFRLLGSLLTGASAPALATLGALVLFCSQAVFQGAWEPHMEIAAALFALLMFAAWQRQDYGKALLWLLCNAALREDVAMINAVPLLMLALWQARALRLAAPAEARRRLRWGVALFLTAVACTSFSVSLQKIYYPTAYVFGQYYDSQQPFAHLSAEALAERARILFHERRGVWLPLLALAAAGILFRDVALLIGAFAFLPYPIVLILSKYQLMSQLGSYSPFPLIAPLLWPAFLAVGAQGRQRRRYVLLQCLILLCGLSYIIGTDRIQDAQRRWIRQEFASNAESYRTFGREALPALEPHSGATRASHAVLALYPYDFPSFRRSGIGRIPDEAIGGVDTLIWFAGDRDRADVERILAEGDFAVEPVPGTRIFIARRATPPASPAE